nr:hypothetical protein [Tanacetum cinerariifolium]
MHNNIMAAGSRDRLPMLAPGRYPQWRSRFLRYFDTRPNATDDSPAVPEHTTVETPMNMSPENKAHFLSEKEAIHLILTGIGDDIYSIVDACQTAQEMWEAIERLQQGMFRIFSDKVSREAKTVPNTVSASSRTKPITVSQPSVITKKGMNSNSNGLSSTGLENTKTRRPQPRSNTKNDRVSSASKSNRSRNKEVKVKEHHRNLLLSKKNKHMSSACNSSKIDSLDVISKVVCAMCKKCLNSINHDVCLENYVNGKKSRGRKPKANVLNNETQQKNQPEIKKSKNVGTHKSLATP